ncbi:hypothetical protein MHTCC0001_18410 [Flavobacteriaceae bacterium MHTCC 0001]
MCLFPQTSIGNNGYEFDTKSTNINTKYSEIGTGFFKDKLILVSSRKIGAIAKKDPSTNEGYKELFCLDTLGNGELGKPLLFSRLLNTTNSEGQIAFSPDQQTVFFTRSSRENSLEYKLYKADLEVGSHGNWVNQELVSFNIDNVSIENPSVNSKGDKLYFSANMADAIGGYDIYVSDINSDGSLGAPKNLGDNINTTADEKYPYVGPNDKYLYFASKGHKNIGGYDLFSSRISNNTYLKPKNLGNTINTEYDEVAYFHAGENSGYFSTNREETSPGYNLFHFTREFINQSVEGTVVDNETKTSLPNTLVMLKDEDGNEIQRMLTTDDGTYSFDVHPNESYTISTKKNGFIDSNFNFVAFKDTKNEVYQQNLEIPAIEPVIEKVDEELRLVVENIYFDFAKYSVKSESHTTLDKIVKVLNKYPNIILAINAHTDNIGTNAYNKRLSSKRAKSTLEYLTQNGIDKNRLLSKGYGETKPIVDCKANCSEDELQTNRRVEFVILNASSDDAVDITNNNGDYHIIAGSFKSKRNSTNKINALKAEGFIGARNIGKNKEGLYMVAYASYASKTEAEKALKLIRTINNNKAWLKIKKID